MGFSFRQAGVRVLPGAVASKPIPWPKSIPLLPAWLLWASCALAEIPVVPYVSTPAADVEQMLDMAALAPSDHLIDLGSGNGRIVIAAAHCGFRAHGVELDPDLVAQAQ